MNEIVMQVSFTTGEVAALWDIAPRTVTKVTDRLVDPLPSYRIPAGKDRRILRDDLIAFMKRHGMPLVRIEDPAFPRVLCVCTGREVAYSFSGVNFFVYHAVNLLQAGIALQAFLPALVVLDYDFCPDADRTCVEFKAYPTQPVVIGIGDDESIPHEIADAFVTKKLIADGFLHVDITRLLSKRYEKKGNRQ